MIVLSETAVKVTTQRQIYAHTGHFVGYTSLFLLSSVVPKFFMAQIKQGVGNIDHFIRDFGQY